MSHVRMGPFSFYRQVKPLDWGQLETKTMFCKELTTPQSVHECVAAFWQKGCFDSHQPREEALWMLFYKKTFMLMK